MSDSPATYIPEPEPYALRIPFWTGLDVLVLTGLSLPAMFVALSAVWVIVMLVPAKGGIPALGILAAQFIAYGLWLLCLAGLLRIKYGQPFWRSMAWTRPPGGLLRYAALGPILAFLVALAGALLRTPEMDLPMMELMKDRLSLITVGVFAVTLGPLCEEVIFRGFYLPWLTKSFGPVAAIVLTSSVFALLHGGQYGWSWRHILLIGTVGAVFCIVRLRTKSTAAAVFMHSTYNAALFAAYLANLEAIGEPW